MMTTALSSNPQPLLLLHQTIGDRRCSLPLFDSHSSNIRNRNPYVHKYSWSPLLSSRKLHGGLAVKFSLQQFPDPDHLDSIADLVSQAPGTVQGFVNRAEGLLYTLADAAVSTDAATDTAQKQDGGWLGGLTDTLETILKVKMEEMEATRQTKKETIASMVQKTEEIRKTQDELQRNLSQAEKTEREERFRRIQEEVDEANSRIEKLREGEHSLDAKVASAVEDFKAIASEVEENQSKYRDIKRYIDTLRKQQSNKVTAFGGDRILTLLHAIERHHQQFTKPPIGPIGAHVALVKDQHWALAIEHAIGKLLNAFVVTNHKDSLLLRTCARESNYSNLQIIIYDFDRPLFSRGSVQTTLPPDRRIRAGRLCAAIDEKIVEYENEASKLSELIKLGEKQKLKADKTLKDLKDNLQSTKRHLFELERVVTSKQIHLRDLKSSAEVESSAECGPNVDELEQEISKVQAEIQEKEDSLEKFRIRLAQAQKKANDCKHSFDTLCDLARGDIEAFKEAVPFCSLLFMSLLTIFCVSWIKKDMIEYPKEKAHYEGIMQNKVIPEAEDAERVLKDLRNKREENYKKASVICPEEEVEALGGCNGSTPEQLSAQLSRLTARLHRENQRHPESIDDLRMKFGKRDRKISKKRRTYEGFREKLDKCHEALELRCTKFQRNAALLRRQLTWQFNGHLKKKGISGHIKVNYNEEKLSVEHGKIRA